MMTMDEYIKKEALIKWCKDIASCEWNTRAASISWADAYESFADGVEIFDSADVATVRHGYWRPILRKDGKTDYECSCCLGIIRGRS